MKYWRVCLIGVCTLVMLLGLTLPVPAELGLDISPVKLELAMTPGTSYNIPLTVHNGTTDATHVQATLVDYGVAPNGDYQVAPVGSRTDSLMRWASMNPREFDLPAGTTQQVKLSIALPSNSNLSGEYAGIAFFQTRAVRHANAVAFSVRVATKIYVTIPNTVKLAGAITKMTATSGSGQETYRVLFKNLGNAHVYLHGELDVAKAGQTVQRLKMPADMLVERGGERLVELSGNALPAGKYDATATIDYGGKTMTGGEIVIQKST